MLRIYYISGYSLPDPDAKEALYDIQSMRMSRTWPRRDPRCDDDPQFPPSSRASRADEGNLLTVADHLSAKGELLLGGTVVDATLIAASPSTKNAAQQRDPEMSQSEKVNQ